MEAVRAAGVAAFGVNVFVPGRPAVDAGRVSSYVASLGPEAAALGVEPGQPSWDGDDYERKLEALLARPPAVVSFTFGLPDTEVVRVAAVSGVDGGPHRDHARGGGACPPSGPRRLVPAGRGGGGSSGQPRQRRPPRPGPADPRALAAVCRRTTVPLIAAGGVGGPADVAGLLARGACLVQAGTAFLRCPESGAPRSHKDALADPAFSETAITRAFSGRRARALVNAMVRAHPDAPPAYPEINNATRPLRAAAARVGDAEHVSLYAGTAFRRAETRAAGEVVERLVSGLRR